VQSELNVVIDAQISLSGSAGGVEQFIAGLVHALGKLDGTERYTVVGPCEQPDWLRPLLGPNQRIVSAPRPPERLRMIKRILGPLRLPLRAVMGRVRQAARARREVWTVPESSGFFSRGEVARREKLYQAGCHHAQVVATASRWSAEDVERSYGVPRDRIVIVPSGASTELYEAATQPTLTEVMKRYRLPEVFALYPAQTWPHKNHLGLIRALAFLREAHGIALNVVCTGSKNRFFRTVVKETHERGVAKQLFFPGYIPGRDLRALYHLAQFLVFPSFFEGGGLPVVEALAEGLPVACSTATSLPEIVRDAALLFDPASPEAMAEVLWRMTTDVALLEVLRRRGYEQAARFSWERMGRTFRALYRRVAGRTLATEDRELLADSRLPPRVGPGPR
jgi:glycosyltransferase involved in cell wall biosynthesis